MKFLKKFLDDNRKSAELRDQKIADFKEWLEAQSERTRIALEAKTADQMSAIEENAQVEMDEIDAGFIDKQKINIQRAYFSAVKSIEDLGAKNIKRYKEEKEINPDVEPRRGWIIWGVAFLQWFLSQQTLKSLWNKFSLMWLELPQEIIDDINEKRQELKQRYFDRVQELESLWFELMQKLDESKFD